MERMSGSAAAARVGDLSPGRDGGPDVHRIRSWHRRPHCDADRDQGRLDRL